MLRAGNKMRLIVYFIVVLHFGTSILNSIMVKHFCGMLIVTSVQHELCCAGGYCDIIDFCSYFIAPDRSCTAVLSFSQLVPLTVRPLSSAVFLHFVISWGHGHKAETKYTLLTVLSCIVQIAVHPAVTDCCCMLYKVLPHFIVYLQ
jgi:hypothetical protein